MPLTVRRLLSFALLLAGGACRGSAPPSYLFVWAGDSAGRASDFMATIDADPASATYGAIVASVPTGAAGTHPHHTEHEMPAGGHLLANGFHAGRTWLFDLSAPRQPRILASFGDVAGLSHPHTFIRLANGHVLATFQYRASPADSASAASPATAPHVSGHQATRPDAPAPEHVTGGLAELDERGTLVRSGSARDTTIPDRRLYPYSSLPLAGADRVVSTTTDMDATNTRATSEWVQFWRLSDLTLLGSIALTPGPRGDEHRFTGEPRLLPDGKGIYIHTFNCGLYLLRGAEGDHPSATLVHTFEGRNCGVPVLTGHYWLQPVPAAHALLALDISDPAHPREVSRLAIGDDEQPHWIAIDPAGKRVVLNSGGRGSRLFVIDFDPGTGTLGLDGRFRDAGSPRAGIRLSGKAWPHGFTGSAVPHGTVFSR